MARNAQARPKWLFATIIGSAAMLLLSPSAAWAGSGDYDYGRHRTSDYDNFHSGHARGHQVFHQRHHYASHKRQHGKRRGHAKHHVGYYCRPCDRYFSARAKLYDHVAYRHDVPFRHLSIAVSFGPFGWIFFG